MTRAASWANAARLPAWAWLAIGAALRLLWPTEFLFKYDEARNIEFSLRISRAGELPTHAWPSSVGIPNGPVGAYIVAAVTRFSTSPLAANLAVVAINIVALAMAIPVYRRLLGSRDEARMALAIHATSPVAIWFSRKIWDPCLLAPFALFAIWLVLIVLQSRRSRWVFLLPPVLALAAQVHFSALFFAAAVVLVLASDWRRVAWGWFAAGAVAGAALIAPYAADLLAEGVGRGVALRRVSALPDIDVVTNLLLHASGHNIIQFAGRDAPEMLLWPLPPLGLIVLLAAIPFYVYLFRGIAEAAARPAPSGEAVAVREAPSAAAPADNAPLDRGARRALLGLGLGLPLLYLVARISGTTHYYVVTQPILFALVVLGARQLRTPLTTPPRRLAWRLLRAPLSALVGINVLSWLLFATYTHAHWGGESYGLPYGRIVQACAAVSREAAARGLGTEAAPLVLTVDIWREKGALPKQYEYVLRERFATHAIPPAEGESPDLTLVVRWPKAGRLDAPPFTIREGR